MRKFVFFAVIAVLLYSGIIMAAGILPESVDTDKNPYKDIKVPTNTYSDQGKVGANSSYENYKSPEFQKKLQDQMNQIKNQLDIKGADAVLPDTDPNQEKMYIFISSSMPMSTLRNYAISIDNQDAFYTGKRAMPSTIMVMRGFKDGMKHFHPTLEFIGSIINKNPSCKMESNKCPTYGVEVNVDPKLYAQYQVEKVPAIVYVKGNTVKKIYGDISLEAALEEFRKKEDPAPNFTSKTYEIVEKDAVQELKERAAQIDWKEKTKHVNKDSIKNYRPQGLAQLRKAEKDTIKQVDMTYTLEFDIPDAKGNILYPKGYKFNPLDYMQYPTTLIVIDGTDRREVEWFKKSTYKDERNIKVLITNGPYYELAQEIKRPVFYADKTFVDLFRLQATPSVIKQNKKVMEVREVYVEKN